MHLSRKNFDKLVEAAIASLPEEFLQWLDEVPVIVEDRPGRHDYDQPEEPLGLYVGHSLGEQRETGDLPPRIMIYRIPLMHACDSPEQLAEEIRKTLIHELGHHAGMDEDDLERHGYGPMESGDIDWDIEDHPD